MCLSALPMAPALAAERAAQRDDGDSPLVVASLADLSIEELSTISISSVSKRPERLADAPAAIFVITSGQIRRSGATSLPEALRLAPNLHVARISASSYAISARGFNGPSANKLLVLIDGRSVYTPLFSGVFWDVQDLLLEDVDRIEVISGPGGTLWGVNAVNGIINIVTKSAERTQGDLVTALGGNADADLAWRHGGRLGESASYRVHAKAFRRDHTWTEAGVAVKDRQRASQMGGRLDWAGGRDRFALIGQAYDGKREQPAPGSIVVAGTTIPLGPIPTSGASLVARFERQLDAGTSWVLQGSLDRTKRTVDPTFAETLDVADIQFLHRSMPWSGHQLVWGGELRASRDRLTNSRYVAFLPARLNQQWASLFAQDQVQLRPSLQLTLGARVERNDYTGNEWLPSARLAWKRDENHLVWGALSRTVRAPSRLDRDTFVPGRPPFLLRGGAPVESEVAKVAELGYRGRPTERSSLSVSAFHAAYDKLRTQQVAPDRRSVVFNSAMKAEVQGLELWGAVQLMPNWRLQAGATRLWQHFVLYPGSNDFNAPRAAKGANPERQATLQSSWDLGPHIDVDLSLRHVSRLPSADVPAYTSVNLRAAWRPANSVELSVALLNLQGGGHGEFSPRATRSEFDRGFVVKAAFEF